MIRNNRNVIFYRAVRLRQPHQQHSRAQEAPLSPDTARSSLRRERRLDGLPRHHGDVGQLFVLLCKAEKLKSILSRSTRPTRLPAHPDQQVRLTELNRTQPTKHRLRGKGRSIHHKELVIGALEVRTRSSDHKNKTSGSLYAGRLRLRHVADRGAETLTEW